MPDFDINDSLGFYLSKGYTLFRDVYNIQIKESGLDLNSDHWTVLIIVNNNPGISQTDISNFSLRDKSSITRIIDFLEKEKYVERRNDKTDRRSFNIFLTKQGKEIYLKLFEIAKTLNDKVLKDIDKKDIKRFKETFKTIIKKLK
jgi:MarR family transcriptional regulator, organic hydroperoxide resistance regulator